MTLVQTANTIEEIVQKVTTGVKETGKLGECTFLFRSPQKINL